MSWLIWTIGVLAAIAVSGWVFRFAGQQATDNAPRFRDMPYGVAFGYALGAALVLWAIYYYFQPVLNSKAQLTRASCSSAGVFKD